MTTERWFWAAAVLLAYSLLCFGTYWRERGRRLASAREAAALSGGDAQSLPVLVAFASQTGQAEQLAWQTARALHAGGTSTRLLPLGEVDAAALTEVERALFVVSTTGEGDAPDGAIPFVQTLMESAQAPALDGLSVGVLALGDSSYQQYCAFGRRLDEWLLARGARSHFERIEVDCADPAALQAWQQALTGWSDSAVDDAWQTPAWESWVLRERRVLNAGSAGEVITLLDFEPPAGVSCDWQAGDLAELCPPAEPDRPRSYSLASTPVGGRLQLMVRRTRRAEGGPGLTSGWLCDELAVGDSAPLRLRAHSAFRIGGNARRPLILIGNGSGLAGLRAHIQTRAQARAQNRSSDPSLPACWLLFGERQSAFDRLCDDELQAWLAEGSLAHLDRAFSRDGADCRYVQDLLHVQAQRLHHWVEQGAAIYVCGSLDGMASGVDAALTELLGAPQLAALRQQGRYCRDVY